MATPHALVLRAPGSNCDGEAAAAFEMAGAKVERIHVNAVRENPRILKRFQILTVPGGFSYGDDIAAGKVFALQLQHFLADALRKFRDDEKLILGICNGFQAILKAGLLMPPDEDGPLATLGFNENGRFEDRWVKLRATPGKCVFLKGVAELNVPVAHGEGNFVGRKEWIVRGLDQSGQVVLRYAGAHGHANGFPENPNGSQDDIAGITDATGRVLGMMPHPERHIFPTQHPQWTRLGLQAEGEGLKLFRNAVEFFAQS
ncbi:phosphoribosylformylglycinamidine synthase I [Urbifossiella limnaea]|uniref:Phosphoribosylformylglycinamidine synthase n=1 Tax=Urbifossiella limnaea TaxID=2528023 RepID=A0A517XSR8_9BACT|nr:phosphoribosylformylglycinamidine synthase I [Urbifossiella limnaea]QDU20532.1 Phosphoribosylformylglycinamidine synthase [Urbifossiella limnaea]